MSEKQFGEFNQKRFITSVELDNSCGIEDLLKNEKYNHFREKDYHKLTKIRDELNELYYENEQLKSENIELKVQLDICKKPLFSKRQLPQENQHIKQTIREAYESERTQIGKNVLKQLLEAIQ